MGVKYHATNVGVVCHYKAWLDTSIVKKCWARVCLQTIAFMIKPHLKCLYCPPRCLKNIKAEIPQDVRLCADISQLSMRACKMAMNETVRTSKGTRVNKIQKQSSQRYSRYSNSFHSFLYAVRAGIGFGQWIIMCQPSFCSLETWKAGVCMWAIMFAAIM